MDLLIAVPIILYIYVFNMSVSISKVKKFLFTTKTSIMKPAICGNPLKTIAR
ncbi:hypothetical protein FDUTEX481_02315 [Tolypothrix sp. PCC 7601]|nr:hypothetical protein FDUTEX481_02315 [Tolypothrix sp. PCC 7601]